jgi:prepilin-type N-terminal cleavage/methylation domain-containing protein
MIQRINEARNKEEGFTLIELLVVIVILGILAAVVVFAVSGLTNKGESSACKIDTRTLRTAEEAYYANTNSSGVQNNTYTDMPTLVSSGLLSEASKYHTISGTFAGTPPSGSAYTIAVADSKCGNTSSADANTDGTPDNQVSPKNPNNF